MVLLIAVSLGYPPVQATVSAPEEPKAVQSPQPEETKPIEVQETPQNVQEAVKTPEPTKQPTPKPKAPKSTPSVVNSELKERAQSLVTEVFGIEHWPAFDFIVTKESGWNPNAVNKRSGACGLFQAHPCAKLGGLDIDNQLHWGINYMKARYGSPINAKAFWLKNGWY